MINIKLPITIYLSYENEIRNNTFSTKYPAMMTPSSGENIIPSTESTLGLLVSRVNTSTTSEMLLTG